MCVWQSTSPGVNSRPCALIGRASAWRRESSPAGPTSTTLPSWKTIAPRGWRITRPPSGSAVTISDVLCTSRYAARPATTLSLRLDPRLIALILGLVRNPGELHARAPREIDGLAIPRVGVSHHPGARIVGQHALEPLIGGRAAVAHHHLPRVDRVADPHAAAVVHTHPRRAARHVEQRIEYRPVR